MVIEFEDSIDKAYELGEDWDYKGYIDKVKEGGDWDFKNRPEYKNLPEAEDFGNFAFGATSQAWADGATRGLSSLAPNSTIQASMRGAGLYQQYFQPNQYRASDGSFYDRNPYPGSSNYGDNWRDGAHVWMGGKYYYKNR